MNRAMVKDTGVPGAGPTFAQTRNPISMKNEDRKDFGRPDTKTEPVTTFRFLGEIWDKVTGAATKTEDMPVEKIAARTKSYAQPVQRSVGQEH